MSYFGLFPLFVFLPLVIIIYNILPKKVRPIVLLIASYIFFYIISNKLIVFVILSSLSIYIAGLIMKEIDKDRDKLLEKVQEKEEKKLIKSKYKKRKKVILILTILFNVSFLFFFKNLNFFTLTFNDILKFLNIDYSFKIIKHLAPIGISFYTLEAISYLVDSYNEKIVPSNNIIKVLLYLSFFPTIMEGPITRFNEIDSSICSGEKVTYHNLCFGYQRIFYGLFKKYVIADRLNIFVKLIFSSYLNYSGVTVLFGAIFYTILLYMEFSGTMDVVIGASEIFNVKLPENFKAPFFSKNISEFWSRWHITLGTWLKDYIFYPVSLSKCVKKVAGLFKKLFNSHISSLVMGFVALFAVWSLNGLWHGAGWTFILFGYYHFILIFLGNIFEPFISKICLKLKINRNNRIYKSLRIIKTTFLIFIGELIFRAPTVNVATGMIKRIFTNFTFNNFGSEMLSLKLDIKDYAIVIISLIVVFVISVLKEKGKNVRESISKKNIVIRWSLYYLLILSIIVFGAYGVGYQPVEPIYADF